jgi:hypothetical protein
MTVMMVKTGIIVRIAVSLIGMHVETFKTNTD